jgi:hypothetical protein
MSNFQIITTPVTATDISVNNFGKLTKENFDYFNGIKQTTPPIPLISGDTVLTTSHKAYFPIFGKLVGGTLTNVWLSCTNASTSGAVEIAIKQTPGGQSMCTTNFTMDEGETNSLDPAVPGVIDTSHDDLVEGNMMEISVVNAGTGVLNFCVTPEYTPA